MSAAPVPVPAPADVPADVPADAGPSLYGVIDVVKPDRIAGWVIDRRDSRAALDVEIRREGRLVATVKAARPRRDLEKAGVGTGLYGFSCALDPPVEAGFEFTVTVTARAADGLTETLRRPGARAADPDRRLVERIFEEVRRPTDAAELREVVRRIEIAQARIEAALAAVDAPAPGEPPRGLRLLVAAALVTATASLVLGIASMLLP